MRPIRSISVLMPTWQGAEFLERVLVALAAQRVELAWNLRVIDSGSTDGTLEILERQRASFPVPLEVAHIHQVEFDHGDTRNQLAADSTGDLLVFLTQDAIPTGPDWLARLAANFADPEVGAAYCKNVPRADARRLTRIFSATDPGYRDQREVVALPASATYEALAAHEKRVLYNFNDVASAVRRELWERHPFPRTWFGEDVLMARALLEGGWKIVYDAAATVEHSHDYDVLETAKRAEIDGRFNAEWLGHVCVASPTDVELLVERLGPEDRAALVRDGLSETELEAECARALELRRAAFEGLWKGGRSTKRLPQTALLAEPLVHVLYVLHGFPPDTWAGTEVYTLNLAKAMQARGHRVTVLARAPALADEPDFTLREDEFEGLRVLRMTHRLQHASIREGYAHPGAEAALREVLREVAPDLVHFQHLIHLSAGCVDVVREFGLPSVCHLHDYWSVCPRVQLIRPDGERCAHNMGAGCHLCVHERALGQVPRLERLGRESAAQVDTLRRGEHPRREHAGPRWEGFEDLMARREVVQRAFAAADLRVSPSRFLRQLLVDTAGFDPHRTIFSDNGMRTDLAPDLAPGASAEPSGPLRIGFVGTLVWYKGDEVLLRAMARLTDREVELNVWGDYRPQENAEHAKLAALAPGNVRFRGRFDNSRLADVYAEIDVLCVPSIWYENSPVTIHEAYMFRTPVVASRLGGMAEYVREGVDGLCFEPGDDEDLARVLARLCDEPGLVRELSRDFMTIKSIAADARSTEFRYRQLVCIDRTPRPTLLCDRPGAEHDQARGAVERQGADMALLRPGAVVEYAVDTSQVSAPSALSVELSIFTLAAERGVSMGGTVFADGTAIGHVEPYSSAAAGADEVRTFTFAATGPIARLRLESSVPGRAQVFLRIARVRLLNSKVPWPQLSSMPESNPLKALKLEPGGPLSDGDLPRITVVILNHNGRHHLAGCFESLAAADYPKAQLDVLLFDNGSDDGSHLEMKTHHSWVRFVANDTNLGFAGGCNRGADISQEAEVLVFLNNDMRIEPAFLRELVAPIVRGEAKCATGKMLSWDGKLINSAGGGMNFHGIGIQTGYLEDPGPQHDVPRKTLFACGGAMAIDAALFRTIGGFDPEFFAYYEDVDLGWRLWLLGHEVHYAPKAVVYHRHSSTSRAFPLETVRLLQVRNPILSCFKNYNDENLRRILPAILALATRRALLVSGLTDDKPFRIEHAQAERVNAGRRVFSKLRKKVPGTLPLRRVAAADLVGINDLLGNWDHWMERRAEVQKKRARPDEEILGLFLKPLWCIEDEPAYGALQRGLESFLGLDTLFEGLSIPGPDPHK